MTYRVAWLADDPGYVGGAELTMAEFAAAAPDGVEVFPTPPGYPIKAKTVVLGNCITYSDDLIDQIAGRKVVKYVHDVWPAGDPNLRAWLLNNATLIFTSPLHRDKFTYPRRCVGHTIPPALDLAAFRPNRQTRRHRKGAVSIGRWGGPGKGQELLAEWSETLDELVTVFGDGPYIPIGPNIDYRGTLPYESVKEALWRFETFVYLPTALEPFGRTTVEAWAAGCRMWLNRNVGAVHWMNEQPEKLESAAADFWEVVLG